MRICLTGHRPQKMYGYNLLDPRWQKLKNDLKEILINEKATEAITGMALGCDTIFALAVLELKDEGHDIKLKCAVPFEGQEKVWSESDKKRYNEILDAADEVIIVSPGSYQAKLLQIRNMYMVDNSDKVIAIWDGTASGTKNCIDYAIKNKKEIIYIKP